MGIRARVEQVLGTAGITIRKNEFTGLTYFSMPGVEEHDIDDEDRAAITEAMHDAKVKAPAYIIDAAVLRLATNHKFHPIRDYVNSLKWDGKPRISGWLHNYFAADDTPLTREISRIVLTAAVKRVFEPGCKFDECLVMVGNEGIGKSTAIKIMAGEWFSDSLPLGADPKETVEQTEGVWLCESAELVGNTPAKIHDIKAFLSRQEDGPFRKAWGRESSKRPRQFIPIATTNDTVFLNSTRGDRRFWPVETYAVATNRLAADRDQLWAEAKASVDAGASIRLDQKLWSAAQEAQEKYRTVHPWESKLATLTATQISLPAIYEFLGIPTERQTIAHAQTVAGIMRKLDFAAARVMKNGIRTTHYEKMNMYHSDMFDRNPETAEVENYPDDAMTETEYVQMKQDLEAELGEADIEDYQ